MLRESVRTVGQRVTSGKDALPCFSVLRQSVRRLIYVTTILLVAATPSPVFAQTGQSGSPPVSSRPSSRNLPSAFFELETKATAAREGGRFADAIALYRKGVAMRPGWDEGWWDLAALLYGSDQYTEEAQAFRPLRTLPSGSAPHPPRLGPL